MSEQEQIEKLKDVGLRTILPDVKTRTIDTLSAYGEKAIPAITEIIERTILPDVKQHGLDAIKKIKEK